MDFLSAKREAISTSKSRKDKTVYIVVAEDGECSVSNAPLKGSIAAYRNGSEVALPTNAAKEASEHENKLNKGKRANPKPMEGTEENLNITTMATKATKPVTKKVAKPTKNPNAISKATTIHLTKEQWAALEKKEGSVQSLVTEAAIKYFKL